MLVIFQFLQIALRVIWALFWGFLVSFFTISLIWVVVYKFLDPPFTPLMVIRAVENGAWPKHKWVDFDKISPNLKRAVIASEDQLFYQHNGFDFDAIQEAWKRNNSSKTSKKKTFGGSTISQQTAKNLFLIPNRWWVRKALEAWFTVLMEIVWSKDRILECYLNSIEMGKNCFGAEAAAKYWFKTSALKLNAPQSALIAALLPSPNRYSASKPGPYIKKRQGQILQQMRYLGTLPYEKVSENK